MLWTIIGYSVRLIYIGHYNPIIRYPSLEHEVSKVRRSLACVKQNIGKTPAILGNDFIDYFYLEWHTVPRLMLSRMPSHSTAKEASTPSSGIGTYLHVSITPPPSRGIIASTPQPHALTFKKLLTKA